MILKRYLAGFPCFSAPYHAYIEKLASSGKSLTSLKSKVRCDLPWPRNLQRHIAFKELRNHWELFMLTKCKQTQKSKNKHVLIP
jgi:hypothetical protein